MLNKEVREMEYIVQTENLSKCFGKEQAVAGLDLKIRKGKYTDF